jgi:lipoprotein signal peptidase
MKMQKDKFFNDAKKFDLTFFLIFLLVASDIILKRIAYLILMPIGRSISIIGNVSLWYCMHDDGPSLIYSGSITNVIVSSILIILVTLSNRYLIRSVKIKIIIIILLLSELLLFDRYLIEILPYINYGSRHTQDEINLASWIIAFFVLLFCIDDGTVRLGLSFLISGGIGNLFSYYIYPFWPIDYIQLYSIKNNTKYIVFNIADIYVVIAVILVIIGLANKIVNLIKKRNLTNAST